ncbi:MAG: extracellular solute-binding protein, partial [Clostridia bacterium]|nr:extracellular solute-binding protein [Clostridia bacterium]
LENIYRILEKMATDEDEVAKNMSNLKSNIGTLGTWLNQVKNQPLLLDYISIQPAGQKMPKAEANFFQTVWFEIRAFVGSFFADYSSLGAETQLDESQIINVWAQTDRDSAQVIRNLCDNNFTQNYNVGVNLRLVAAGTLLPATLSGTGPDVALENAQNVPVQYAIRNAVLPLNPAGYEDEEGDDEETKAYNAEMREIFSNFDEVIERFSESATVPLSLYGITYGLPETQTFSMMFYRKDVLADLGLDIPRTWDDLMSMVPVLQYNHMEVGIPNSSAGLNLFLYQMGGDLYADDGMRINLDSNLALEAFDTMCSYFTQYSFPYQYDPANRFRTGEMPIIFADYITMYNQLTLFATEIRGLWEFVPIIGMADEDGNINNVSISTVTSIIMMNGCEKQENAWKFMDWYTTKDVQAHYANEKVAIVGQGAMFATANKEAIMELPWTSQEKDNIAAQYNNLAAIPEMPGGYIISRYVDFAFLAAYNNHADPVESLLGYIDDINKEITRKRKEFDLDTLELGETLADREAREQSGDSDK